MTFTQWHRNHSCDYGTVFTPHVGTRLWVQDGIYVALADWLR